MALDEALFHWSVSTGHAAARFYHWDRPAVTVGYFHRPGPDHLPLTAPAGTVRRYTGGGLVEHGEDLTFALTMPAGCGASRATGAARYRWIHEALADSLAEAGLSVALEPANLPASPGPCFSHPVPWDLRDSATGRKIGGGAQRRTRGAVIHQGSVRLPAEFRDPQADWIPGFLQRLSEHISPLDEPIREILRADASDREKSRYGRASWNHPD
jgi:lipoyl(octanoyl) transferase